MREIVIEETMQDMDKDKDGFVTLEEYISECVCVQICVCYGRVGSSSSTLLDNLIEDDSPLQMTFGPSMNGRV